MNLQKFYTKPVIGILRDIEPDDVPPLVEAAIAGGLEALEVTMNTRRAPELIQKMIECAADKIAIGAGTVHTVKQLEKALNAGAGFIVSPIFDKEIAAHCRRLHVPYFPGALTPQEVYNAWVGGAAMVKLFPMYLFGPSYLKTLCEPFDEIKLLACGGVTADNVGEVFANQASGAAFGSSIFKQEWIKNRQFDKIEAAIRAFINAMPKIDE